MEFEELISTLVAEHKRMKSGLKDVRLAISRKDFASAGGILRELDDLFKQHIADEEAQVLRLLIDAYGIKGADEAIQVFRQHRPIYDLMNEVEKLASLPPQELSSRESELRSLLDKHTLAEETRVFPRAVLTYKDRAGARR